MKIKFVLVLVTTLLTGVQAHAASCNPFIVSLSLEGQILNTGVECADDHSASAFVSAALASSPNIEVKLSQGSAAVDAESYNQARYNQSLGRKISAEELSACIEGMSKNGVTHQQAIAAMNAATRANSSNSVIQARAKNTFINGCISN